MPISASGSKLSHSCFSFLSALEMWRKEREREREREREGTIWKCTAYSRTTAQLWYAAGYFFSLSTKFSLQTRKQVGNHGHPTSKAPLVNFLQSSDAEILFTSTDWACRSAPKRAKNVCAGCTYSDWASILHTTIAGWAVKLFFTWLCKAKIYCTTRQYTHTQDVCAAWVEKERKEAGRGGFHLLYPTGLLSLRA